MALKLTYCQLIKIVLSQIGGSPLQQVYTQLSQGLQQITKGGGISSEFSQLATFVEQVTTALNAASYDTNAATAMAQQFFYNPVGTVTTETIGFITTRLAAIEDPLNPGVPLGGYEAEHAKLLSIKTSLTNFKTHTDVLSGVTDPYAISSGTGGGFGGCTLADLLGNGCAPAADVPDVDLQVLIDGFKSGTLITQVKTDIIKLLANQVGYTTLLSSLNTFQNSIDLFNTTVTSKLNKMIVKKAVETYITNLAFSLLSGCSNQLVNATIRPAAKEALTPFVEYQAKVLAGTVPTSYTDTTLTA